MKPSSLIARFSGARLALVASLALTGCAAQHLFGSAGDEPPMTGETHTDALLPIKPAWRVEMIPGAFHREPRRRLSTAAIDVAGGRVAIGPGDGWFYCLNAENGKVIWKDSIPSATGQPIYDDGRFVFGTEDGLIMGYNAETGEKLWQYQVQGSIRKPPITDGSRYFFIDGRNVIYAVDRASGSWRWQYRRDPPDQFALFGEPAPTLYQGKIFAGFSDGHLVALNPQDGAVLWTRDLAPEHSKFQDVDATPQVIQGVLYAASAASGLHALDPETGEVLWSIPILGISSMVKIDGEDLVVSLESSVMRVSPRSGKKVWETSFGTLGAPSVPALTDKYVVVSVSKDGLHFLDATTGRPLVRFRPGKGMDAAPAASADGTVVAFSNGGTLYGFRSNALYDSGEFNKSFVDFTHQSTKSSGSSAQRLSRGTRLD